MALPEGSFFTERRASYETEYCSSPHREDGV